ncbi:MAG: transporter permease [Herbinix sp.]|nr:transporter permease [Herbinix sp.]
MLSYLKSEFYRLRYNEGGYLFIAVCSLLLLSSNIVLFAVKASEPTFPYATTYFAFSSFYSSIMIVFFLCISVATSVFGNEHSNHTMKNSISYGINRNTIYLGKLIVEVVYAMIAFVIITAVDIGSAYLLLENSGIENLMMLFKSCFVVMPLLLCAIAVTNFFLFLLESNGAAIGAVVGVLLALPLVSNFLGMKFRVFTELSKFMPYNMITKINYDYDKLEMILPWSGISGYYYYWIIGIIEIIIISAIGVFLFQKKEVK